MWNQCKFIFITLCRLLLTVVLHTLYTLTSTNYIHFIHWHQQYIHKGVLSKHRQINNKVNPIFLILTVFNSSLFIDIFQTQFKFYPKSQPLPVRLMSYPKVIIQTDLLSIVYYLCTRKIIKIPAPWLNSGILKTNDKTLWVTNLFVYDSLNVKVYIRNTKKSNQWMKMSSIIYIYI